jgi:hypothetical protein
MEKQRKAFSTFVSLNLKKASETEGPVAHMQYYSETMDNDAPLLLMEKEDILSELDVESPLVRWLLNQLTTYDCRRQKIVGLIFDKRTVISDVYWTRREIDPE